MNREAYLSQFRGAIHGSVEIIDHTGNAVLRGTGVFIPCDTRLYACFNVGDCSPFTINKYCVLFHPYDKNYILSPVAIYDRLLVNSFNNLTRQYDMSMLLKSHNYDAMLEFIKTGAISANVLINSQSSRTITPNKGSLVRARPLRRTRPYGDGCALSISALINPFTEKSYNLIVITNSTPFISTQTIRRLLNALKLYWYLYHIEHYRLQVISVSFKTNSGSSLQLFCTEEQIIDNGRTCLPPSISSYINTRRLHKIISTYLLDDNPRCQGLCYAIDEFLRLATNQSKAYVINDYVRQPILVLDSLITNIRGPSHKRTPEQKQKDKQSIQTVLGFVNNNKDSLSDNVYKFYSSKTANQIIGLIYNPPFKQKITSVLSWLKIQYSESELNLDDISRIRNQIVHGQKYDIDYILDKSITRNVQHVSSRNGATTVSLSIQEGIVDTTLKIIQSILTAYFDKRCSYAHKNSKSYLA